MPAPVRWVVAFLVVWGVTAECAARGLGIKAGEGRLHPAIDLDLAYDSNPSYRVSGQVGDMVLHIRPGFTLSFPSEKLSFEFSGKVGYDYYFGIEDETTSDLSAVAGEAELQVGFNPKGQVSLFLGDTFTRSGDPRYNSLTGKFDRTDNEAKATLEFKPGGGALMLDLAYGFFIDWFDKQGGGGMFAETTALSNYGHRIYFSGKWKFLPKTAVTLDFDSDLRRYPNRYTDGSKNVELNAIRATAGLLGQITPTMALVTKVGYGNTLIPDQEVSVGVRYSGEDYSSVVGQVEISFRSGTTFIQVGYLRGFQPVVLFAYFGQDGVYAHLRQQIAGKFSLSADLGFDWMAYGTAMKQDVAAQGGRSDGLLSGGISLDYHIKDWVQVGVAYDFQARFSDWQQPLAGAGGVDYNKHMFAFHIGVDY